MTIWQIADRLQLPEPEIRSVVEAQRKAGHVETTAQQPPGLMPAVSPESLSLRRILDVARSGDGEVPGPNVPSPGNGGKSPVVRILEEMEEAIAASVGRRTLKDLVEDGDVNKPVAGRESSKKTG